MTNMDTAHCVSAGMVRWGQRCPNAEQQPKQVCVRVNIKILNTPMYHPFLLFNTLLFLCLPCLMSTVVCVVHTTSLYVQVLQLPPTWWIISSTTVLMKTLMMSSPLASALPSTTLMVKLSQPHFNQQTNYSNIVLEHTTQIYYSSILHSIWINGTLLEYTT